MPLPTDTCQHSESEDCMTCSICGTCDESLDENDVCGSCADEALAQRMQRDDDFSPANVTTL